MMDFLNMVQFTQKKRLPGTGTAVGSRECEIMRKWIALLLTLVLLSVACAAGGEAADDREVVLSPRGEQLLKEVAGVCDSGVIWYALNETEDPEAYLEYVAWLADVIMTEIEPSAVEKLMQVPVFMEAVMNQEISRYMTLGLTYNDVNQFGAMVSAAYVGDDGNSIRDVKGPVDNMAYRLFVNLLGFGPETRTDPSKRLLLEDTLIHEMMHAFMYDYNRNAMAGTDRMGFRLLEDTENEQDNPVALNEFPSWFAEGTASTVQAGFGSRPEEFVSFFGTDLTNEELWEILSDRQRMMKALTWADDLFLISLEYSENTYNMGYVACMYLYSLAAEQMGLETVRQSDGITELSHEALLAGMNRILKEIHDGMSFTEMLREISRDPQTGEPLYQDADDFVKKCFRGENEPGLIFFQHMMQDYISASYDPQVFVPSGSVLPGYVNSLQPYLEEGRGAPEVFILCAGSGKADDEYAISTVRPSKLALGGGLIVSYDPVADALSQEEAAARDVMYIGDQIMLMVPANE